MRKLTLSILAASIALLPATAIAEEQRRGGGGHGGGQWRGGGGHGGGQWRGGGHRGGGRGGFVGGGFFGGGFWGGGGGGSTVVIIGGDGQIMHPGADYRHRRLRRGGYVHPYWYGPQFHVGDWRSYGFADPGRDHRWVRYYDDAYMIDRRGRVVDRREDLDWDRYGEEWEVEDGIPAYRGRRGYHPTEEDYAWFERHEGEEMAGHDDHRSRGDHRGHDDRDGHRGHGGGWDMSGYAHGGTVVHGGGYGYGYGYAYPIVIETTTTYGQSYSEEVVEEYVEVRRPRARACNCARPRAAAPRPRAPAPRPAPRPRPPAGERG